MKSTMFSMLVVLVGISLSFHAYAYSDGPAAIGGVDGTGSPRGGGSCAQCHGAASDATQVSLTLYESTNQQVVTGPLVAGESYLVELQVTNSSYSLFGGQVTGLNGQNEPTSGIFTSSADSATQIFDVFGTQYMENFGRSSTGVFKGWWQAPMDEPEVTFYFAGVAVNGSGRGGDKTAHPGHKAYTVDIPCQDIDNDGLCFYEDDDQDNDGVPDADDTSPEDPSICQDSDQDGCDDCAIGSDDFGPMSDALPENDGPDSDGDGLCDSGDRCEGDNSLGDIDRDGICGSPEDMGMVDMSEPVDMSRPDEDMGFVQDMGLSPGSMDMGHSAPLDMDGTEHMDMSSPVNEPVREKVEQSEPLDEGGCQQASTSAPSKHALLMFGLMCMALFFTRRKRDTF